MGKLALIRQELAQKEEADQHEEHDESGSDSDSSSDDDSINGGPPKPVTAEEIGLTKTEPRWQNRSRCLVFCSRGCDFRVRHLMNDIRTLMPHTKTEAKFDKNLTLPSINEIAEMKNCDKVIYFENRKHTDNYMWISNVAEGPSIKFYLHNIHTMKELKMSGNCLKASRPLLSFDSMFDKQPHLQLIKNTLLQIFPTPHFHPRSQPFIDHVFSFTLSPDGKIWFRNFQIVDDTLALQEIGPRFVMDIIRIFDGSFEGSVLYDNPEFESPNTKRRIVKLAKQQKYMDRKMDKEARKQKDEVVKQFIAEKEEDPAGEIFNTEKVKLSEEAENLANRLKPYRVLYGAEKEEEIKKKRIQSPKKFMKRKAAAEGEDNEGDAGEAKAKRAKKPFKKSKTLNPEQLFRKKLKAKKLAEVPKY